MGIAKKYKELRWGVAKITIKFAEVTWANEHISGASGREETIRHRGYGLHPTHGQDVVSTCNMHGVDSRWGKGGSRYVEV